MLWLFRSATRTGLLRDEAVRAEDANTSRLDIDTLRGAANTARDEAERALDAVKAPPPNADPVALAQKSHEAAAKRDAASRTLASAEVRHSIESATGLKKVLNRVWGNIVPDEQAQTRAYSLARTQMLVWTLIVAMSMVWIWQVTNNNDVLTPSVLILLGISVGTALSATTVERNKETAAAVTLEKNPADAEAAATLTTPRTYGFWTDLISDRNGPVIARVQMVVFTLILMGMFVHEMVTTLVMPELSGTLLGLMGITSAAYVSFKIPEKKV
jgi:hypothetical protein